MPRPTAPMFLFPMGGFLLILKHKKMLGGQLNKYYHFMPSGSMLILLNCIYKHENIRSTPIMNNSLDLRNMISFEVDHQALKSSHD